MNSKQKNNPIRLGGPVFDEFGNDPVKWVNAHRKLGYSAAYCPVDAESPAELKKAFEIQARKSNLIIAEVGAWSNPISPDEKMRTDAFEHCCSQLQLADEIDACCCVNIAGSRNPEAWDGPHPDNFSQNTFEMIVEVTRKIIDTVNPHRTFFALETMPWIFPYSVDSYVRLIKAIDRKQCAVHFDPVNIINSPERYYLNGTIIKDAFRKLGPHIKSCHAKDTILRKELTTHLDEIRPGLGNLEYAVFLTELSKLVQVPLMLEHLEGPEEYSKAAEYIRKVGRESRLTFAEL
jgi:sugar phosphate isomerase/epimerase